MTKNLTPKQKKEWVKKAILFKDGKTISEALKRYWELKASDYEKAKEIFNG